MPITHNKQQKNVIAESRDTIASLRDYFSDESSLSLNEFEKLLRDGQKLQDQLETHIVDNEEQRDQLFKTKDALQELLMNGSGAVNNAATDSNYGGGSSTLFRITPQPTRETVYLEELGLSSLPDPS